MAKLTDYKNPISGSTGNIFDFKGLWSQVLGVFVLLVVFATGQKVASTVERKVKYIDASPGPLTSSNVASAPTVRKF